MDHGLCDQRRGLRPDPGRYAQRFECLTYDNRGAGRSGAPLRPTSIPELAADALRVLDAAGIQSAHVLGVSMGGMIAQELAIRFPHRVRGLILGATTPGGPLAARPALRELAALTTGGGLPAGLFSPEFRREHPQQVSELLRHFRIHRPPSRASRRIGGRPSTTTPSRA